MNKKIVVAVVVIAGAGIMNSWIGNKPITPVIIGSYVFLFVLSILDMFGGGLSKLSGALAMLAVVYVLITEVPWQSIISFAQGTPIKTSGGSSSGGTGIDPLPPGPTGLT